VARDYNASCLGGRDNEVCGLRAAQAKKLVNPISISKMGMMVHACDPSYAGGLK
jgi:hypothetical protein